MLPLSLILSAVAPLALAATADDWRGRAIYQLVTDRFYPATADAACVSGDIAYCGGTWATVTDHLDYIESLGFDAVWISPTSLQVQSDEYGAAFHGYWPVSHDILNPHFGNASDLRALADALHARGMYLMVDVVFNHLVSLTADRGAALASNSSLGPYMLTNASNFHDPCAIDWANDTSIVMCWDSLDYYVLMDVATETPAVQAVYWTWIEQFVQAYAIDGLRLDMARSLDDGFMRGACAAAGVFCIGEVWVEDFNISARYQNEGVLDSVLGYPMYYGWFDTFASNGSTDIVAYDMWLAQNSYNDPSVIGNFISNHDLARFSNLTSSYAMQQQALVASFMFEGIPIVYYGTEADMDSATDPMNRAALWQATNYVPDTAPSTTSGRIMRLNALRTYLDECGAWSLANSTRYGNSDGTVLTMSRDETLTVLTTLGDDASVQYTIPNGSHPFSANTTVADIFTCATVNVTGSGLETTIVNGLPLVSAQKSRVAADPQDQVYVSHLDAVSAGFC